MHLTATLLVLLLAAAARAAPTRRLLEEGRGGLPGSSLAGFALNSNIQGYPEIYADVCDIRELLLQNSPDFAGAPPRVPRQPTTSLRPPR